MACRDSGAHVTRHYRLYVNMASGSKTAWRDTETETGEGEAASKRRRLRQGGGEERGESHEPLLATCRINSTGLSESEAEATLLNPITRA